jgi:hypothetical protein
VVAVARPAAARRWATLMKTCGLLSANTPAHHGPL